MTKAPARGGSKPSYHDLHITTEQIPRTSIFNLPYGLEVGCNRIGGWSLWRAGGDLLAGEYDPKWLVLDVGGHVIVDSRPDENTSQLTEKE